MRTPALPWTIALALLALTATHLQAGIHDYKWNPTTGHVYGRTDYLTWQNAQNQSAAAGGSLATINDAAENAWVLGNFGGGRWIGFSDVAVEGTWVWAGDPGLGSWTWPGETFTGAMTYQNFATPGEPNNAGSAGEHYAELRGDGRWNDLPPHYSREGVCEFQETVPDVSGIGVGTWRYNPATNHLYAQTNTAASWTATKWAARLNGGAELVTINDAAENAWVASTFQGSSGDIYDRSLYNWTGLSDTAAPGTWTWASGDGASYRNWAGGEPSLDGHAVNIFLNTNDPARLGQWNDLDETEALRGIVEKNAGSATWRFNPHSGQLVAKTDALLWPDARLQAQAWGGDLVAIHSQAENDWLRATLGGGWIGLTDSEAYGGTEFGNTSGHAYPPAGDRGNGWVWASGEAVDFQNWNGGEPNDVGGEDYAELRGDNGRWNDLPTNRTLSGIAAKAGRTPTWIYNPTTGHYYALTDSLRALDAQEQAKFWGGHLATVNDAAENAWLAARYGGRTPWIGFSDAAHEGLWAWFSGTGGTWDQADPAAASAFVAWNQPAYGGTGSEPNNAGNEDFALLLASGLWNDYPESRYLMGIVERTDQPELQIIVNPATGKKYGLLGIMGWEDAQATARAYGGNLVTVQDQAENEFLRQMFAVPYGGMWLGYNDLGVEGMWEWASGQNQFGFANWNSSEPNNVNNEDFAMLYTTGLWNDTNAASQYYAVMDFIPEPASMVLLLGGLAALVHRRRRPA